MRVSWGALIITMVGCGSAEMGAMRIDPVLAALVPADSIVVAGLRMGELRGTSLYGKLVAQKRLSDLDDFAKNTNFDPRKDVNDLLIASDGMQSVALARGNFRVQAPAGTAKSDYKGVTVYGSSEGAYAIVDSTTAIAGPMTAIRKVIDQKRSGGKGAVALLDRARALPGPGQIWMVSQGWGSLPDKLSKEGGNLSNLSRFFRGIQTATAVADLHDGLVAHLNGDCRTEQDAKTLGDAARGLVGLGRLTVPEGKPEMMRLFDGIKVDQKQNTILVNVNIPADLIDGLLQMSESHGSRIH